MNLIQKILYNREKQIIIHKFQNSKFKIKKANYKPRFFHKHLLNRFIIVIDIF